MNSDSIFAGTIFTSIIIFTIVITSYIDLFIKRHK